MLVRALRVVGVIMLTSAASSQSIAQQTRLSMDELIEGMKRLDDRFTPDKSYHVHFRDSRETFTSQGGSELRDSLEVEHFREGNKILVRSNATDSDKNQEAVYWDGHICTQVKNQIVYFWPFLIPQGHNQNYYTQSLFVDTYRGLEWGTPSAAEGRKKNQSEQHFYLLPKMVADNRERYTIRPALEDVDGHMCHVLEWPGRDLIKIDAAHGFVARSRTLSYEADIPATTWSNLDLFESKPGCWLPRRQEETRYFVAPREDAKKIRQVVKRNLLSIRFDPINEAVFEPVMPDKSRPFHVIDSVRGMSYRKYPKEIDPLSRVVSDAQSLQPIHKSSPVLLQINAIVMGLASLIILSKHHRSRVKS